MRRLILSLASICFMNCATSPQAQNRKPANDDNPQFLQIKISKDTLLAKPKNGSIKETVQPDGLKLFRYVADSAELKISADTKIHCQFEYVGAKEKLKNSKASEFAFSQSAAIKGYAPPRFPAESSKETARSTNATLFFTLDSDKLHTAALTCQKTVIGEKKAFSLITPEDMFMAYPKLKITTAASEAAADNTLVEK